MTLRGQKLQALRRRMGAWRSRLRAATGAMTVDFPSHADGSFDVVLKFPPKTNLPVYTRKFCEDTVFSPGGIHPLHKPCDYIRQVIDDVLRLRGVT